MNGAEDLAVYRKLMDERYLAEDVEEIRKVHDAVGKWQKLRKPINQWLVEYSLNKWIEGVSNTAGVAPSFDSVFERYRSLRAETDIPEERYDRYDCRKKWVQRYMKTWSPTRNSMITHEADCSAEVVRKVFKNTKNNHLPPSLFGPILGTFFVTQIKTIT